MANERTNELRTKEIIVQEIRRGMEGLKVLPENTKSEIGSGAKRVQTKLEFTTFFT